MTDRNGLGKILFFCIVLLFCAFLFQPKLSFSQADIEQSVKNMMINPKIISPDMTLKNYRERKETAAVIVMLRRQGAVEDRQNLGQAEEEVEDAVNSQRHEVGTPAGRQRLQNEVRSRQDQFLSRFDPQRVRVSGRFSYLFGFAAEVTLEGMEELVNSDEVVSIEEDRILQAHLAQGIPLMNGSSARSSYNGSGLSIAVCDTGIDTSHPMLGGGGFPNSKVIGGYDAGDDDYDPRPDQEYGDAHGTACAGIAAGSLGTEEDYIGGVAPGAKLYAVKISTGNSGSATTANMIEGWEWCITHQFDNSSYPIMIISTSFGGGRAFSSCDASSPAMTQAAANAVAAGITIFCSSGNDGYCDSIGWPACISHVISVGAVYDAQLGVVYPCVSEDSCAVKYFTTACTNWYSIDNTAADMVTSYSNTASFLSLLAPSDDAYTTDIVGPGGYSFDDYSPSFGGTSAACPYAAGAAAVLQSAAKAITGKFLTSSQVKSTLINTGDAVADGKVSIIKPRVNLGRAVGTLRSGSVTSGNFYVIPNPQGRATVIFLE
jgi:subtilisin family serine protease